jgi:uncharacterized protein
VEAEATGGLHRFRRLREAPPTGRYPGQMDSRRALSVAGLTGSAALLAAAGGATWFYASRVTEPPHRRPVEPIDSDHVVVLGLADDDLVLSGSDAARPGWWGVRWDGGYARVGPPVSTRLADATGAADDVRVRRPIEFLRGEVTVGAEALFDPWSVPADDPGALGVPVEEVSIDGPIGPLPAWRFTPGTGAAPARDTSDTWAVLVHGRSGSRVETLRIAGPCLAAGLPSLAISYRNDPDAPASPDGRSHLGATEWMDVEAAVGWALANGAEDVVLVGLSMGGACVAELLRRSRLAPRVRAVVLEAPVLDWGPVLRRAAAERGLPTAVLPLLLPPTMALAGARTRIDFRSLGSFDGIEDVPVLLVHGDADTTVPIELADALAVTASEVVTYLRVADAGHLRAWNLAREEVESAITGFLDRHLAAAPVAG